MFRLKGEGGRLPGTNDDWFYPKKSLCFLIKSNNSHEKAQLITIMISF